MKAFSTTFLILIFTIAVSYANGQISDQIIRQIVLQKSIVDSTFVFWKWTEKEGAETHLRYLGQVTSKHGRTLKIINSILFWGLSHRTTCRILIFNGNNEYLGNYYVTVAADLPTKMKNGNLIFKNIYDDCDKKITTVISFKNGLPKHFFRKCKGGYGDIYNFETD